MDARDGGRHGLPVATGDEILFLAKINKRIRAIDLAKKSNIGIYEAFDTIDKGDEERLKSDAFDDPRVSRDTVTRTRKPAAPSRRQTNAVRACGQISGGFGLLFMLVRSKYFAAAIIFMLSAKFLWPMVKPFL